jgi:SRSO17 transposase
MTILEHPEAQALLNDAVLTVKQVEELGRRMEPFLQRYFPLFQRAEQRTNALHILEGKLSSLSRKTCEPIAHSLGVRREVLQDFIGVSPWDDQLILAEIRKHVAEVWHDPNGVLLGDGSGFPKKGDHSCGVKRQYCGRLGKVDNCQIGIFLGYACRYGHTLLDHRLFLPKEWANDPQRREKTGVPEDVVYKESWEIFLDQVDECKDVPHSWVTADAEFGRVYQCRKGLRERQEQYVLDVRNDMVIRDLCATPPERKSNRGRHPLPPWQSIEAWTESRPATVWQRFEIRAGEKRPLLVEACETQVQTQDDGRVGEEQERLVVIRTVNNPEAKTWSTLSNAVETVPLLQVVWAHAQRHWEEASFKEGKSEVGMAHYEVRGWRGWHHHMTMSLLALWFLGLERFREQTTTPALTVSLVREVFSRVLALWQLSLEEIVRELNATLRRKEEARIYHWFENTGKYPPRRTEPSVPRVVVVAAVGSPCGPPGFSAAAEAECFAALPP